MLCLGEAVGGCSCSSSLDRVCCFNHDASWLWPKCTIHANRTLFLKVRTHIIHKEWKLRSCSHSSGRSFSFPVYPFCCALHKMVALKMFFALQFIYEWRFLTVFFYEKYTQEKKKSTKKEGGEMHAIKILNINSKLSGLEVKMQTASVPLETCWVSVWFPTCMIHSWCLCYSYLALKQAKLELSTFSGEGIHPTAPYWSDMNHSCLFSLLTQRELMDQGSHG